MSFRIRELPLSCATIGSYSAETLSQNIQVHTMYLYRFIPQYLYNVRIIVSAITHITLQLHFVTDSIVLRLLRHKVRDINHVYQKYVQFSQRSILDNIIAVHLS